MYRPAVLRFINICKTTRWEIALLFYVAIYTILFFRYCRPLYITNWPEGLFDVYLEFLHLMCSLYGAICRGDEEALVMLIMKTLNLYLIVLRYFRICTEPHYTQFPEILCVPPMASFATAVLPYIFLPSNRYNRQLEDGDEEEHLNKLP
ncbi:hypothetical protein E1B28_011530 [Marasmius oreades]|uniref:Uncharacterized protein n=1 Tax=Marasmius oreades TaxID=181124 RepID=A0A9P7URA6_9AGAR|nr:uncharacterized protein E1B28_011530 [Marasmius oreades]KAG7089896.1 hypothetical protein E1B28_011530 [Marasmius oreades]